MGEKSRIVLPILGALLAAVVGGAVWAAIAIQTDYEIGLLAWAIGGLAGFAVVKLSGGRTNVAHQLIAVIASLLGIFLGKYFIFSYLINEGLDGMFNNGLFTVFMDNIQEFFGAMDIVFIILAIFTAWKMPARLAKQPAAPDLNLPS